MYGIYARAQARVITALSPEAAEWAVLQGLETLGVVVESSSVTARGVRVQGQGAEVTVDLETGVVSGVAGDERLVAQLTEALEAMGRRLVAQRIWSTLSGAGYAVSTTWSSQVATLEVSR